MIEILSSILASDLLSVGAEVQRMLDNGVDSLHVDIMDAHFVPNLSFGPAMVSALKKAFPAVHRDVHLMMDNPEKYLDTFISAGAGAVTVHAEVPGDVRAMLAKIRAAGIKAGVSIKPGTGVDTIKELLPLCDLVLVMTVEPGFGGQKFMADMMPKIAALRELGYRGQIMVDGGINADTAAQAVAAGADALVMGTALLRAEDPAAVVRACHALEGRDVKQQYGKRASNRGKPGEFQHKHSLGQNFLTDAALLESLVDETGVGAQDAILEVGPGAGDMTRILAARCRHVTSVEIDRDLLPILRVAMEKYDNFSLVQGDILRVNLPEIMAEHATYHVVANIPYYLTTELLNLLLSGRLPLRSINVMIQKEAAQRLLATPSTPEYGPLAIRAQYYTQPRVARIVEAACFTPPPKVDSAFVCMPWRDQPAVQVGDEARFFRIVNAAFALRRKTLCNNLTSAFRLTREEALAWIARAGLPENIRGEALSLQQFADLANAE